jgi:large-conductance mechanosensitive channel
MYDFTSLLNAGTLIPLAVEFGLGFGFGYYLGKFVRALIGLLVLGFIGVAINYAQFVTLSSTVAQKLGVTPQQFLNVITAILPLLALTVIAPLTVGVVIGFLVGH